MVSTRRPTRRDTFTPPRQIPGPTEPRRDVPVDDEHRRRPWILVLFALVIALIAIEWTGQTASSIWLHDLDSRLLDAGAGTNVVTATLERTQLEVYRTVAFTEGIAPALVAYDSADLARRLAPIDANQPVPMIDLVDTKGRVVFAFRAEGAPAPLYRQRNDLDMVKHVLAGQSDRYGERYADLITTQEGPLIATVGPIELNGTIVGAVLVMTPLDRVLSQAANEHGALLTAFSTDRGDPLATTSAMRPLNLGTPLLAKLADPLELPYGDRIDVAGHRERRQFGGLSLRHKTVAYLSASLPDRTRSIASRITFVVGLATMIITVLAGYIVRVWSGKGSRRGGRRRRRTAHEPMELPEVAGEAWTTTS